ncbi:MAG: alpha/beta hydrolase [Pseudomonadota bacterium]
MVALSLALLAWSGSVFAQPECVILLHGLARTSDSMSALAEALEKEGFMVANVDYPSRQHPIEELAEIAIPAGLKTCAGHRTHFVTHSLGGILVRYHLQHHAVEALGRVVMIGPPNQGSEVVDDYRKVPGFKLLNGPAGLQLGTDSNSVPRALGEVAFDLGVIAGTRTMNPILSQSLPNPDDGKVSVANTKVAGMADFIALPHTHTFMMQAEPVIEQTVHYLHHGRFRHDNP